MNGSVPENNKYTLTPIKNPEKFNHEANFAYWNWDLDNNISITNDDFDNNAYKRDKFMTTKDAMEEITKYDTTTTLKAYVEKLASNIKQQQNIQHIQTQIIQCKKQKKNARIT